MVVGRPGNCPALPCIKTHCSAVLHTRHLLMTQHTPAPHHGRFRCQSLGSQMMRAECEPTAGAWGRTTDGVHVIQGWSKGQGPKPPEIERFLHYHNLRGRNAICPIESVSF